MSSQSTFASAAFEQLNLVLFGAAALFSLLTWSWWPILIGGVGEVLYLAVVPSLPAYRARLDRKRAGEQADLAAAETNELRQSLPPAEREKYDGLLRTAEEIKRNYAQLHPATREFLDAITVQLDKLLGRYLSMSASYAQSVRYLDATDPRALESQLIEVTASLQQPGDQLHEVEEKQQKILRLRIEKRAKAEENAGILRTQLETIAQFILLLKDQSFTLRDPKEISGRIDAMMSEVESTESTVKELEGFFGEEA